MKLTEDAEIIEIRESQRINNFLEDTRRSGVKLAEVEVELEDPKYFQEADELLFTTRSRWARYFKEAGIAPQEEFVNTLQIDKAMRNQTDNPAVEIEGDRLSAQLVLRDLYDWSGQEYGNHFELQEGDMIGRFGAMNLEEIAVNPGNFSVDFPQEESEMEEQVNEGQELSYTNMVDPTLHPDARKELDAKVVRDISLAELENVMIQPKRELTKQEILEADLSELVRDVDILGNDLYSETVGPGNYLLRTKEEVTEEGFYTMLYNPGTAATHLNSRIGDPDFTEPMVVELSYDTIIGEIQCDESEAYELPGHLQATYIKKTD